MKKLIMSLFMVTIFSQSEAINIALATMTIGKEYQAIVLPGTLSKNKYCEMNGYKFLLQRNSLDTSRPIPWSKIVFIQNNLPYYDWIFWSDADSIVMNKEIELESLIDEDYDMIVTRDFNNINTGQFLIRNSEWSRDFLERIYAKTEFTNHPWWEQQAIIDELEKNEEDMTHVKIIPQRLINSYPSEIVGENAVSTYQEGDFIIHFPSYRTNALKNIMIKYYYVIK